MLYMNTVLTNYLVLWATNLLLTISAFGLIDLGTEKLQTYLQISTPIIYEINRQINFPHHINLGLEATSSHPITDVIFYYTFNGQDTVIYGKPPFTPNKSVEVSHKINSNKADYLPPGLLITWHCKITDSQGNTIETEKETFIYLDPSRRWQKIESENLNLYWYNTNKNIIRKIISETNILLTTSKNIFDFNNQTSINAVIINNDRNSMPPISSKATSTHLYQGFAFAEYNTVLISKPNSELLAHELVHIYLDQKVGIYKPFVPAWLNEGLANYFTASPPGAVKLNHKSQNWFKLKNMHKVPGKPLDVHKFYNQSEKVVAYLIGSYDEEKMKMLLEELSSGKKITEAMLKSYGFSLEQLDSLWPTNSIYERKQPINTIYVIGTVLFILVFIFSVIIFNKNYH